MFYKMFCNFCGKVVFTLRWVYGKQDDNVRCTSVLSAAVLQTAAVMVPTHTLTELILSAQ